MNYTFIADHSFSRPPHRTPIQDRKSHPWSSNMLSLSLSLSLFRLVFLVLSPSPALPISSSIPFCCSPCECSAVSSPSSNWDHIFTSSQSGGVKTDTFQRSGGVVEEKKERGRGRGVCVSVCVCKCVWVCVFVLCVCLCVCVL